jgi:CubicO group peptidase (beta-lactamase class C family)
MVPVRAGDIGHLADLPREDEPAPDMVCWSTYDRLVRPTTEFSGSLLVARDGVALLRASAGQADVAAGRACSTDTRFQTASVSKQFTAAAVMLLVDDGAIDLHDDISRVLPGCAPHWRELTLHQLLTHTSGLEHWTGVPDFEVGRPGEPDELLERFARVPLRSTPGTTWHYSSPGYLLAARVVEAVGAAAYADIVTERIFGPAGMAATLAGRTPPEPVAWGYREGRRVDVPQLAAIPGTGDVWSTVEDLVRFTEAFEAGELLSAASRQAMVGCRARLRSPTDPTDPAPAHAYGYGYFLGSVCGHPARFHPGDNPGYRSFLAFVPELRATVAILCNNEESDLNDLLRALTPELARIGADAGHRASTATRPAARG